jgi:hypothetical protein
MHTLASQFYIIILNDFKALTTMIIQKYNLSSFNNESVMSLFDYIHRKNAEIEKMIKFTETEDGWENEKTHKNMKVAFKQVKMIRMVVVC